MAKSSRLPFRNKRSADYTLLQPVIKIPRVTVPAVSRATENESPEVEISGIQGSQSDRDSPFTPTPEPQGFPTDPFYRAPSNLAVSSNTGGRKGVSDDRPVVRPNIDPEIKAAADELCVAVHASSRCSSARDSAVGDLSPAPVPSSCADAMTDAYAALYRDGDYFLSCLLRFMRTSLRALFFTTIQFLALYGWSSACCALSKQNPFLHHLGLFSLSTAPPPPPGIGSAYVRQRMHRHVFRAIDSVPRERLRYLHQQ